VDIDVTFVTLKTYFEVITVNYSVIACSTGWK